MSASDLRDAFNSVAAPAFNCQRATLHYVKAHDVESQVLTFMGASAAGQPFTIESSPLRPDTDVNQAAKAAAQQFLDKLAT